VNTNLFGYGTYLKTASAGCWSESS